MAEEFGFEKEENLLDDSIAELNDMHESEEELVLPTVISIESMEGITE